MKNDEFAFLNQQLAAMVRDGIPLETALRRLCADMQRGQLRTELEKLEADLAKGIPLRDAVRARQLPELYRQMLEVGVQSNDLPGVLTMLADHYQKRHVIWTRLKGLMVYPAIVLFGAFVLSCVLTFVVGNLTRFLMPLEGGPGYAQEPTHLLLPSHAELWNNPWTAGLAVVAFLVVLAIPKVRGLFRGKGAILYIALLLFGAYLLAVVLARLIDASTPPGRIDYSAFWPPPPRPVVFGVWVAPLLLGLAVFASVVIATMPRVQRFLRWRVPAFKDASIVQVASALSLMLKGGVPLDKALGLVKQIEAGTPAESEIGRWARNLAAGKGKFSEMAEGGTLFPPLFVWTVSQSHEDLAGGFQRAAELYQSRAAYHTELLLYSAMPCAVLALGAIIVTEIQPVIGVFAAFSLMEDAGGDK